MMLKMKNITDFIKSNPLELIIFFIFCLFTVICSCYHECSFDELQAWGIAKDNLYNILFYVPHIEGHPPVWYLILKFFQIFTTNPELVVKIPNLLIMYTAIWLLIFKSPFPKILRLTLPFTYFLVYQYSIISRPYSLLILGLFLACVLHTQRDNHPCRYVFALAILASSSIYGMLLATAIALLWALDVVFKQKENIIVFITKDKRFFSLLGLFVFCLSISLMVIPVNGVIAYSRFTELPHWQTLFYFILGLPSDATAFNVFNYHTQFATNIFHSYSLISWIFGTFLLINIFKIFLKNGNLRLFLFTYVPVVIFMEKFYIHPHHIGIITAIFIYVFWVLLLENKGKNILQYTPKFKYFVLFIMLIQIYWGGMALHNELIWNYSPSRVFVNYIKENHLTDYKIFSTYNPRNPHLQWVATTVNPYFGKNIFMNYNLEYPNKMYIVHQQKFFQYEVDRLYNTWEELGSPDVFLSEVAIPFNWRKYFNKMSLAYDFYAGEVYKDKYSKIRHYCYVDRDKLFLKLKNGELKKRNEQ